MGLWDKLTKGLRRTQEAVTDRITQVFQSVAGEQLDDDTADDLEAALLASDLGPDSTDRVLTALRKRRGLSGALVDGRPKQLEHILAESLRHRLALACGFVVIPDADRADRISSGGDCRVGGYHVDKRNAGGTE